MSSYAVHRTSAAVTTLAAASVIIFFFIHLIPGDPLYVFLGDVAPPDQVAALRTRPGLAHPPPTGSPGRPPRRAGLEGSKARGAWSARPGG